MGVIPVGIAHGYRPAHADAHVLIDGKPARILRPCLESTVIDLSGISGAATGMTAVLLGDDGGRRVTLAELCRWQGVSQLVLLTSLLRSLHRRY